MMKTKAIFTSVLVVSMLFAADAFAQRGRRAATPQGRQQVTERPAERYQRNVQRTPLAYCMETFDLTEAQEEEIQALRLEQIEKSTEHRNQMDELRARKRTLMTTDGDNSEALNQVIDEMSELRNARMKASVNHRQAVRELLTEEQRVIFDNQTGRRPGGRAAMGRRGGHSPRKAGGRW
ncbi:MAG: Spy/CpxP family protein refolding chaperone [Bacteroidales bacterium]